MTLRPETALILSSIDYTSIARFPEHLDPCIEEAVNQPQVMGCIMRQPEVMTAPGLSMMSPDEIVRVVSDPTSLRKIDVNAREAVAKCIRAAATIEGEALSDATPIPGVRIPTVESGQPQIPIPFGVKLPTIDLGGNTIEFQEVIAGIKPPSVPMIIPFMEKLPLLPGWTIRDNTGAVVNEGMKLPLVEIPREIFGIKIPDFLPSRSLGSLGAYETAEPDNQYSFDDPEESIHRGMEVEIYPDEDLDEMSVFDMQDDLGDPFHDADESIYDTGDAVDPFHDGLSDDSLEIDEEMQLGIRDTAGLEEEFET